MDWAGIAADLDAHGCAVTGPLLAPAECAALAALTTRDETFRSRVVMARHGFGRGEYQYFAYPLPELVAALRARALPAARRRSPTDGTSALGRPRFPAEHAAFLARCHAAGQTRPTPLLLRYGPGDYNCLHQDLYGEHVFPLQAAILLSEPGRDFTGGEFVLTEQRPRMQSRAEVVPLRQGEGVIFAVNQRPVTGARGTYRVTMRHGVSRLRAGSATRWASSSTTRPEGMPGMTRRRLRRRPAGRRRGPAARRRPGPDRQGAAERQALGRAAGGRLQGPAGAARAQAAPGRLRQHPGAVTLRGGRREPGRCCNRASFAGLMVR